MNSSTTFYKSVIVKEKQILLSQLSSSLDIILASPISVEQTKNILAIYSNVLSGGVSCSLAPNCSFLHRNPCSTTSETCGECIVSYIGQPGHHNTMCNAVNASSLGNLKFQNKLCPNNCTGIDKGVCKYYSTLTKSPLSSCGILDSSCVAACLCKGDNAGSSCSLSNGELTQKQDITQNLLTQLSSLTSSEDPHDEAVRSWISNLGSLSANPDLISPKSAESVSDISSSILDASISNNISPDVALPIMDYVYRYIKKETEIGKSS